MSRLIGAPPLSRRSFLHGAGALSATAVALLGGRESLATSHSMDNTGDDVAILNVALGLEHEAIAAYQIGAESANDPADRADIIAYLKQAAK